MGYIYLLLMTLIFLVLPQKNQNLGFCFLKKELNLVLIFFRALISVVQLKHAADIQSASKIS